MIGRLLGLDRDALFFHFYLRHPWPAVVVVGCIMAALVYSALLYRREPGLSLGRKVLLASLRAVVLAVIIIMLFEPAVGVEHNSKIRKSLLCLVDVSESMNLADPRANPADIEEAALGLGLASPYEPATQQALASAIRRLSDAAELIAHKSLNDLPAAHDAAAKSLNDAIAKLEPAASASAQAAKNLAAVKDVRKTFEDLRAEAAKLQGGAKVSTADLAERYVKLAQQLDAAFDELIATAPVTLDDHARSKGTSVKRIELAQGMLQNQLGQVLAQVGNDYNVRFFRFGDKLDPSKGLGEKASDFRADDNQMSKSTRLGWAVEEAIARHSGQPIGGVIVLTDGGSNDGQDPVEVARRMKERGIRIFPIGIGLAAPDNLAIKAMIVPDVVFHKDQVPLRIQIASHGYAKRRVDVSVSLDGKQVAGRNIELQEGTQFEQLTFQPENRSGDVKLEVAVSALPGQIDTSGTKASKTIRVIDEKIKVLYLEGRPRWEYRYLRAILKRDYRLDVKFVMTEGDPDLANNTQEYLAHFPEDSPEAFKWDSIIIGDVKRDFFTPAQLEKIKQAIKERGGSLIFLAGQQYPLSAYADTPLAEMLPVTVRTDAEPFEKLEDAIHPVVTDAGRQSLIMALDSGDQKTVDRWNDVKPLYEVPALSGAKPGATVLAELSDKARSGGAYPLIAWQRYGTGKVMYIGSDQFWRMRLKTGDKYHARFWGQTIQFMALSHLLAGSKPVSIETEKKQYNAGDDVRIYANVMNDAFEPVVQPSYPLVLERVDGQDSRTLKMEPVKSAGGKGNMPGLYQVYFRADHEGRYRIKATAEGKDPKDVANSVEFDVKKVDRETAQPEMQEELLRKMAELSGGRYLTAKDMVCLPGLLNDQSSVVLVRTERELWDVWPALALVLLFAGVEWYLRRRSDLV